MGWHVAHGLEPRGHRCAEDLCPDAKALLHRGETQGRGGMDAAPRQLRETGNADWKTCYFHHPLYSSARSHGPDIDLRKVLELLFVNYRVDVVLPRARWVRGTGVPF
jgi:hypothetical protein